MLNFRFVFCQIICGLLSTIPNAIWKEPLEDKSTSPRSYWTRSPSDDSDCIQVDFDPIRSKGCSVENRNTVKHVTNGKAIGLVKHAMTSGCYQWNVSLVTSCKASCWSVFEISSVNRKNMEDFRCFAIKMGYSGCSEAETSILLKRLCKII